MKATWETVNVGMGQLLVMPLLPGESIEDRAIALDNFISFNGWSWDEVIEEQDKSFDAKL